jgi:hypothetical protein
VLAEVDTMTHAFTLWLDRLLSLRSGPAPLSLPSDRKPLEIEVERLPDHLWRALGFALVRRPGGE